MDRQIVYPGSIPLDSDLLNTQRNTMIAIGYLAQMMLGSGPIVDGLACTPTTPASLGFTIGPGSIAMLNVVDTLAFGSLAADAADPLLKIGINIAPTHFTCAAPTTSGQSVNYLVEASLEEADVTPVVLPYYNAAAPTQPYSGPNGSGAAQNTQRIQRVQLQVKAGVAAVTGSQATPPVDNGWVGLYTVVVNYGQTQITPAAVTQLPASPFLPFKLPALTPGFSRLQTITTTQQWTVPPGVTMVRVRLVGGGGGGGGGNGYGGGGGGAGGYSEGVFTVVPGSTVNVTIGAGGAGSAAGVQAGSGGTTSFGGFNSASGGLGGGSASASSPGGAGGTGFGAPIVLPGGYGADGQGAGFTFAGNGGASALGGGGRGASGGGAYTAGQAPGSGGGGCYGPAGVGGNGAAGIVLIEY